MPGSLLPLRAIQAQPPQPSLPPASNLLAASSPPESTTPQSVRAEPSTASAVEGSGKVSDAPEEASQILRDAIRHAVWGPPVACQMRQRIQLFNKTLVGVGQYVHAGQGSGKVKMILQYRAGDLMNSLLQVSDGKVLYTSEHIGDYSQRTRVDLGRVRRQLGTITAESLEDPVIAMYLSIGGQAELLRKLYQRYHWTQIEAGQLGERPVWWLTGQLAEQPPPIRSRAAIDEALFLPDSTGLTPRTTRIAVGRGGAISHWVYRLEQFSEQAPQGSSTSMRVITEYAEPAILQTIPKDLFVYQTSVDPVVDKTRDYLPPNNFAAAPGAVSSTVHR